VTGAAGFAGGHLLDLLTAEPPGRDRVPIVGWHRPGRTPPERPDVEWQAIDVVERVQVIEAVKRLRPAIVYHCAGAAHVGRAWEQTETTFKANVLGTHNLLEGLARIGAPVRVLVPGSAHVYRPDNVAITEEHPLVPASPYGLSKLAQELLGSHARGAVTVAVARAFNHFGPGQHPSPSSSGFAQQLAATDAGQPPPQIEVGNLDARRDLTDVRDTVRAYRLIAERGAAGRPYNVCSGTAVGIGEVLEMFVARARVPIQIRVDPARLRPSDFPVLLGDPSRLRAELGWTPQIPLSRTVDDVLDYWRTKLRVEV
jgi:GDP-4-dehydro-6-deoxy-D-mannose reductase